MTVRQTEGQPMDLLSRLSSAQDSSASQGAGAAGPNGPVKFGLLPPEDSSRSFQSLLDASRASSSGYSSPSYSIEASYAAPIYSPGASNANPASPGNGILPAQRGDRSSSAIYHAETAYAPGNNGTDTASGRNAAPADAGRASSRDDSPRAQNSSDSSSSGQSAGTGQDGKKGGDAKAADQSTQSRRSDTKAADSAQKGTQSGGNADKSAKAEDMAKKSAVAGKGALKRGVEVAVAKLIEAEAAALAAGAAPAQKPGSSVPPGTEAGLGKLLGRAGQSAGGAARLQGSKLTVEDLRSAAAKAQQLAKGGTSLQSGLFQVKELLAGSNGGKVASAAKTGQHPHGAKPNPVELLKQQVAAETAKQLPVQHAAEHHNGGDNANPQNSSDGSGKLHAEQGIQAPSRPAQPPPAPSASGAYTELARQLRDGLKSDIVREAKVVLRDNNSGEIRMTLRPESLGRVRIQLHVLDNRIGGQIFVDNVTVRDVFQQNLSQLYQAFRDSGFETGMLEVAVGNGQTSQGDSGTGTKDEPPHRRIAPTAIGALESSVPRIGDAVYASSTVNLVV